MSIEALAMTGVDYMESGIDFETWECGGVVGKPPPYLLAEKDPANEGVEKGGEGELVVSKCELVKLRIQEWAKTVASVVTASQFEARRCGLLARDFIWNVLSFICVKNCFYYF
ncbi:hypothetical protein NMG60_11007366 [Bertholletia excelsa]